MSSDGLKSDLFRVSNVRRQFRENGLQRIGYRRFRIYTRDAPHAYPVPSRFDVSAKKIRPAAMLVHEAFVYKFVKEVVLSRPSIYGVYNRHFGPLLRRIMA